MSIWRVVYAVFQGGPGDSPGVLSDKTGIVGIGSCLFQPGGQAEAGKSPLIAKHNEYQNGVKERTNGSEALAEAGHADVWGAVGGLLVRELSQRPQRNVQSAESGADGLAQTAARSVGKALQGPGARRWPGDPGQVLGACTLQHVHGPCLFLQAADLHEGSGGA